jgi:hypothetical protein
LIVNGACPRIVARRATQLAREEPAAGTVRGILVDELVVDRRGEISGDHAIVARRLYRQGDGPQIPGTRTTRPIGSLRSLTTDDGTDEDARRPRRGIREAGDAARGGRVERQRRGEREIIGVERQPGISHPNRDLESRRRRLQADAPDSSDSTRGVGISLLISSSGGFFVQQDSHTTQTYSWIATVQNEVVTGTFGGEAPDGDESCSLSTDSKKDMLTPDQKRELNDLINKLMLYGVSASVICGAVCYLAPPFTPECALICGVNGLGVAVLVYELKQALNDPPDPNFMVFATPSFTDLICDTAGVPQNVNDTCSAFYVSTERATGLALAIFQTFNKAQGAHQAGDAYWEAQQTAKAEEFEAQLSTELLVNKGARINYRDALLAWGMPQSPQLTSSDAFTAESNLFEAGQGCTSCTNIDVLSTLSALGLTDPTAQQEAIQNLITQNIDAVATLPTFPDLLTWQPLMDALGSVADTFGGKIGVDECWKLSQHKPYPVAVTNPIAVPMADRFGSTLSEVRKGTGVCFPAIAGPDASLLGKKGEAVSYSLKRSTPLIPRTLTVMNDLDLMGSQVTIFKEDSLRIPATIPEWPNQATATTGYMKCYKAKGRSLDITLPQVSDGFTLVFQPVNVRAPSKVCVPVDVHGLDPAAPTRPDGVVCYRAKAPLRPLGRLVSQNITQDDGSTVLYPESATIASFREYCLPSTIK